MSSEGEVCTQDCDFKAHNTPFPKIKGTAVDSSGLYEVMELEYQ